MSDVTGEGRPAADTTANDDTASEQTPELAPDDRAETAVPNGAGEELAAPEPTAGSAPEAEVEPGNAPDIAPQAGEEAWPGESLVEPEPSEIAAEQIEWQPVVDGDKIEWQPVVAADAETYDELAPPESEPQPEFEYPEGTELDTPWDAGLADPTAPVSGNGAGASGTAAGASETAGATSHRSSGPRRPPGRPPAARSRRPPSSEPPDEPDDRRAAAKTKRQVIILSLLTVTVIGVAVLGFLLSRDAKDKGSQATTATSATPSNTLPRLPDSALQTYSDDVTGFTLKFAKTWEVLRPPNADVRLVVNAGGNDAFRVRVMPIQTPATVENIGNIKAVTDAIVFGDKSAKSIKEQLVTVNGLLAYYYLYTFHDPVSNQEGVHAQYFVFEGNRMFTLTFQSVPVEDFARQASLWDQVAESFTAQPRPVTTTAAPPETTSPTSVP